MIHPAVLADMIRQSRERDRQREDARRAVELARLPEQRPADPAEEVAGVPLGAGS